MLRAELPYGNCVCGGCTWSEDDMSRIHARNVVCGIGFVLRYEISRTPQWVSCPFPRIMAVLCKKIT